MKQESLLRLTGPGASEIQTLAARSPEIARRLVSWTPSYVHALSIAIQAGEVEQAAIDEAALEPLDTTELLRNAGFCPAEQLLPVLNKLESKLFHLDDYRRWHGMMAHRMLAGVIQSEQKKLARARLDALADLHPELHSHRIISNISVPADVVALNVIIDTLCRTCPDVAAEDVRRSLRQTRTDLNKWLREWFVRSTFPEPPFPGSERLVPLRTGADMKHISRTFENCLYKYVDHALAGRLAFCVWKGSQPALIALKPLGMIGWVVDEIKGPNNRGPSAATKGKILAELSSWGCFTDGKVEDRLNRWRAWSLV